MYARTQYAPRSNDTAHIARGDAKRAIARVRTIAAPLTNASSYWRRYDSVPPPQSLKHGFNDGKHPSSDRVCNGLDFHTGHYSHR